MSLAVGINNWLTFCRSDAHQTRRVTVEKNEKNIVRLTEITLKWSQAAFCASPVFLK